MDTHQEAPQIEAGVDYRFCAVCGRRRREGWRRLWRPISHTDCWISINASPILVTEYGDRYLRIDPVPRLGRRLVR